MGEQIINGNKYLFHMGKIDKSVNLLDKFTVNQYTKLILENYIELDYFDNSISLVIGYGRVKNDYKYDFNITMTKLKSIYGKQVNSSDKDSDIREFLNVIRDNISKYKNESVIVLDKVIHLRGQTSTNRTGYGNEYDGYYLVHEGTNYGETSDFYIEKIVINLNKSKYDELDTKLLMKANEQSNRFKLKIHNVDDVDSLTDITNQLVDSQLLSEIYIEINQKQFKISIMKEVYDLFKYTDMYTKDIDDYIAYKNYKVYHADWKKYNVFKDSENYDFIMTCTKSKNVLKKKVKFFIKNLTLINLRFSENLKKDSNLKKQFLEELDNSDENIINRINELVKVEYNYVEKQSRNLGYRKITKDYIGMYNMKLVSNDITFNYDVGNNDLFTSR